METYGRMSGAARKVIKHLGDKYEQLHGGDDSAGCVPRSVFVDHYRQVIGITLQRAISTQLTNNFKMRKASGPHVTTVWTYARAYLSTNAHCVRLRG